MKSQSGNGNAGGYTSEVEMHAVGPWPLGHTRAQGLPSSSSAFESAYLGQLHDWPTARPSTKCFLGLVERSLPPVLRPLSMSLSSKFRRQLGILVRFFVGYSSVPLVRAPRLRPTSTPTATLDLAKRCSLSPVDKFWLLSSVLRALSNARWFSAFEIACSPRNCRVPVEEFTHLLP